MHKVMTTNNLQNYSNKRKCSLQLPAAISSCLIRLGFGTVIHWSSPAIPHLTSSNSKFIINSNEASWVVSLATFGALIGFLLYPLFFNRIGRKYTMLLFAIPQIFSWLTIYYASNVYHLYAARILSGIGYSASYVVDIIYVGEIAEKNIRGFLIVIGKIAYVLGSLIVVILGAFVTYDNMNLILLLISLIFVVTFSFMPESPYFYIKINREEDAFQSLVKLRGTRDTKLLELEIESMKKGIIKTNNSKKILLMKLFSVRSNRKALLICTLGTLSFAFSGSTVIAGHAQTIIGYIDTPLKPEQATVLIMIIVLISSIIISPIPDLLGRRILTFLYGILVGLSSFTIGGFFFYKYYFNGQLSSIYWIPFVALLIYIVGSSSGLLSLSQIQVAELLSIEIKSSASSINNILWSIVDFFLQLSFGYLVSVFKIYGVFWLYGIVTLIITLSNYIIMPETKGKTLEEIQELLEEM